MLRCSDGSLYTGISKNIEERIRRHNTGKGAAYTRSRRPVILVWSEGAATESSAKKREAEIKDWTKAEKEKMVGMTARSADLGTPATCPAAFLVRGGKTLIGLRHYTADKFKKIDLWTCPGGRCEPGETVEQALRRETEEETGVRDLEILAYLGDVPGAKTGDTVPVFVCRSDEEPRLAEPEKFSEWRWVKPAEMPENFINPAAMSRVAVWLAGRSDLA